MSESDSTPTDDYSALPVEEYRRFLLGITEHHDGIYTTDGRHIESQREIQSKIARFRLLHKFGIDEIQTKISILREEFEMAHEYSPIEHVKTRIKSLDSIAVKAAKLGCPPTIEAIREQVRDIAGVRITCPFVSDAYWVADILTNQPDVELIEAKDYIALPKPNGYRSLHLIVHVPIFLSDRTEKVCVEIQIRTIAMDFWASLEHKIHYKYDGRVPAGLVDEFRQAAQAAHLLDEKMAKLRAEVDALVDELDEP